MKRIFVILGFLVTFDGSACDACGCQLGGLSLSMLPQHYKHFVGLRYSQASFTAQMDHESDYFEDEYSHDTYRTAELIGRISLAKRWKFNFILPYLVNEMDGTHQKVNSQGIGDPKLLLYYSLVNKDAELKPWKHQLMVGGGVKLPVGDYKKEDNGEIVNRNFQLGSGSVDYLLTTIYSLGYGNWGLSAESALKLNTRNDQDYRFGNQFNSSLYAVRYFAVGSVSILPYAGFFYEKAQKHTEDLVIQQNTGGSSLLATMATRIGYRNASLNLQYQTPISQNYHSDNIAAINAKNRFSAGLLLNIPGKK